MSLAVEVRGRGGDGEQGAGRVGCWEGMLLSCEVGGVEERELPFPASPICQALCSLLSYRPSPLI